MSESSKDVHHHPQCVSCVCDSAFGTCPAGLGGQMTVAADLLVSTRTDSVGSYTVQQNNVDPVTIKFPLCCFLFCLAILLEIGNGGSQ